MPEIIVEVLGPGYTRRPGIAHEGSATPAPELPPPRPLAPRVCQADLGEPASRRRFKIIIQNGRVASSPPAARRPPGHATRRRMYAARGRGVRG